MAWGQDRSQPGNTLNAYLAKSALILGTNKTFGRAEIADKDNLFLPGSPLTASYGTNLTSFMLFVRVKLD